MRNLYRMAWFASLILLVCLQQVSTAQMPQNFTGQWVLTLGEPTLLVLSIHPASGKADSYAGTLSRPTHLQTADAVSFSHIVGPTEIEPIVASSWKSSSLTITVQNPTDAGDKTTYVLTVTDQAHAELRLDGIPLPPMKLTRTAKVATVSEDWHSGRTYSPDDDAPSNPEMKHIFDDDQEVRQSLPDIDWSSVEKSDAIRRASTMKLLNAGSLHSGEDFEWAANVFQHGSVPDDFLLAHTLAIVALRKGYSDATWISAATLDRYLQSIKQPQIYGTQFLTPTGQSATQEPYKRTLVTDALRRQLKVPDLAAQQVQRQQYDSQRHLDLSEGKR